MSHLSQEAVLLWSILGGMLLIFLVWHLWKFDKFNCLSLRSNKDGRNGGFKRLMTYSYLCSIPLLLFYAVTITVIKYCQGHLISGGSVVPLPYALWGKGTQHWITILYVALSLSWALEIVSHLEELNFWLFLLALEAPQNWFKSPYFFTWAIGSVLALAGLPATALATRHDPLKAESWIFFVGSMFDLLITLVSLKVLWQFPRFLGLVRNQGADPETMVRLETYSQLNSIRVLFRFLFAIPLFILAADGIRPGHTHTVNQHMFATDFLAMIAGIGCFVSSMLTLLVFFPRSLVQESGYTVVHPDTLSKDSVCRPPTYRPLSPQPSIRLSLAMSPETENPYSPSQGYPTPYGRGMLHRTPSRPLRNARPFPVHSHPEQRQLPTSVTINVGANEQDEGNGKEKEREKDDDELEIVDRGSDQDGTMVHIDEAHFPFEYAPAVPLEDITYDQMQARGSRYGNMVRRADAVHPYLRHFVSPLDVYDHFHVEEEPL